MKIELSDKNWNRLLEIYKYGRKHNLHSCGTRTTFYQQIYKKYNAKRGSSKHKFTLTMDDWVELWDMDLLHNANSRYKKRMICRIIEPGPYSRENVYIGDPIDNSHDCIRNGNHATAVYDPVKHNRGFQP